MTSIRTYPWDVTEHWECSEDIAIYLEAVLEDGDISLIALAMREVARAFKDTNLVPASRREELTADALKIMEKAQGLLDIKALPSELAFG